MNKFKLLLWVCFVGIMLHTFYYAGIKLGLWAVPHAIGYTIAGYFLWSKVWSLLVEWLRPVEVKIDHELDSMLESYSKYETLTGADDPLKLKDRIRYAKLQGE